MADQNLLNGMGWGGKFEGVFIWWNGMVEWNNGME